MDAIAKVQSETVRGEIEKAGTPGKATFVYYAKPFKSDRKIWKLMKDAPKDWDEQIYCVPSEEFKFNKLIRDGGVGKQ